MNHNAKLPFMPARQWGILLLLVSHFLILWELSAQPEIKREFYSTRNGLPNNSVSDMMQDSRGYMWFATWDGLSRFDGYDFVNYPTGTASRVPFMHNRIRNIFEDSLGNIWALMYDEKIFRLNRKTDQFESLIEFLPDSLEARMEAPLFTSDGGGWIAVRDRGVLEVKTDSVSNRLTTQYYPLERVRINQLFWDSFSTVWAATTDGIRVLSSSGKIPCNRLGEGENVLVSAQLEESMYWGSETGDLFRYDYTTHQLHSLSINPSGAVLSLTAAPGESALYIGTERQGLFRYDARRATVQRVVPRPYTVTDLYSDSEGLIWMLTDQPGVTMYDPQRDTYTSFVQKVIASEYSRPKGSIMEQSGVVWVRMNKGGFGYYDRQSRRFEYFHNHPDDPEGTTNVLPIAKATSPGLLWTYTSKQGVEKISIIDKKVERRRIETKDPALSDNDLRAFCYDRDSLLWVAAKSGLLYCLDQEMNEVDRISCDDTGHPLGRIYDIAQDPSGDLWLGTRGNGLFRMHKEESGKYRFQHYTNNPADSFSLSSNDIFSILIDSRERIWIGTYGGGINLLDEEEGELRFLSSKNSLKGYPIHSCHNIRSLAEDERGQIWVGTTEGAVVLTYDEVRKDVEALIHRKDPNDDTSLSSNDIVTIYTDRQQRLWLATIGGGLNQYLGVSSSGKAQFVAYTVEDGLPSNDIRSLAEDREGNLWFASEYNITSFNGSNGFFSTLSSLEGVDNTMFSESAAIATADGNLLFGTVDGYYWMDKSKFSSPSEASFKLQITDCFLNEELVTPRLNDYFDQYIPETSSVTLPDRHSVFTIRFASLNYSIQHRVHYQYMLEGRDVAWKNGDLRRKVTYVDLPAGNYRFLVRAFLPENPDIYDLKSLTIQVPPYFWESGPALVLYAFVLLGLLVGGWYAFYRHKKMLRQFRILKIGPSEILFQDDKDYKFISGLLNWLEENYMNPDLKIEDLVAFSGLGRTTFYNRLKNLTQMSPVAFVSDFRMKKAKMYIEKTHYTIAEIAYQTGFNDPVYFTRMFKSRYHMTPTECRKKALIPLSECTVRRFDK